VTSDWRSQAKRYGAPAAFLLAVTIAVLLIRSALQTDAAPVGGNGLTAVATTAAKPVPLRRRRYYRLRAGETLSNVAIRFNTSVAQLLAINPGIRPNSLVVGQRVRVK
jgi:spore germination protein YaaH